jgi:3-dehydroquinate synthase
MAFAPPRVFIVGPSGSGKSTLAQRLADRLEYRAVDVDAEIEARLAMSIGEFIPRYGEPAFRAIESQVLVEACPAERVVVATGGGVVLDPANWTAMRPNSAIVALMAEPEVLAARVSRHTQIAGASATRPLLAGDAVERLRGQLAVRGPLYAHADVTIQTDQLTPEEICEQVCKLLPRLAEPGRPALLSMATPTERSDIHVAAGALQHAPSIVSQRWPQARRIWIVSDSNVAEAWAEPVKQLFAVQGFDVRLLVVPPGEASKSLAQVAELCELLTTSLVSRRDVVVALGGGVIGDVAGFVAAIALRGLPLVQLPTSLLAMVDSSVGGKTGVNTSGGKNMVGAFYQPGLVVIDPVFLSTLPSEELSSGLAEVIKHAVIQPSTPYGGETLMRRLEATLTLDQLDQESLANVIAINVSIKHSVVQADERETGLRMILNFGHTAGHAIEADGFRYRHGEAVGLGMLVAARISELLSRTGPDLRGALDELLREAGLPTRLDGDAERIITAMARDKKNLDGSQRWILPCAEGGVEIVAGVALPLVRAALESVGAR